MNYCSSCGSKLSKGAKFCANCGSAINVVDAGSKATSAGNTSNDGEYQLTEMDNLCADVMAQLDQLIENDNIDCINFFDKSKKRLFSVKYEYEVIDTIIPPSLADRLTVFIPDDDDEDVADKHVYLLPDDFFEFDEADTGFALLAELFELGNCEALDDVRCEIVLRNKRGDKGVYVVPQA